MLKLIIKSSELTPEGVILINSFSIIDSSTGDEIRIAKITPELHVFLQSCEIDISDYSTFISMKEKNPVLKKLVTDFNLILTAQGGAIL
jgi:hypothetical protein